MRAYLAVLEQSSDRRKTIEFFTSNNFLQLEYPEVRLPCCQNDTKILASKLVTYAYKDEVLYLIDNMVNYNAGRSYILSLPHSGEQVIDTLIQILKIEKRDSPVFQYCLSILQKLSLRLVTLNLIIIIIFVVARHSHC